MEVEKSNRINREETDDHEDVILPGFRFHPTDDELVGFYLRRKVEKKPLNIELIKQIDIYKHDPWDLPKLSSVGEKEWYFFSLRGRKYRNSIRPNRVTRSGFWKATGIDKPIYSSSVDKTNSECIGLKKSLVYYKGSAGKGTKTDWMMHEFRLPTTTKNINAKINQEAEVWTICRIFKRSVSHKKYIPVPDWNGSSTSTKQIPTDSSSITCSFESGVSQERHYCFGESTKKQQLERKPTLNTHVSSEEMNPFMLVGKVTTSVAQDPSPPLYSAFPNVDAAEFYRSGSWDELGAVVEFAIDPTFVYGCRYS